MSGGDGLGTEFFLAWIDRLTELVAAEKDRLTTLDAAIGDGDHGTNLNRGFTAARVALELSRRSTRARCSCRWA